VRVSIDRDHCEGYVNCVDAAPDVFEMDGSDKAIVLIDEPGSELHVAVRRAVRMCPAHAVIVSDDAVTEQPKAQP
jgi:ferredoxin